ncbi:hypothetical protein HMPREF1345_01507 [Enterococcus faecium TX1337RF]|nr:hypothetical protein HMPREF1345_01507 [Enterococcus faecium TX1337RF]
MANKRNTFSFGQHSCFFAIKLIFIHFTLVILVETVHNIQ